MFPLNPDEDPFFTPLDLTIYPEETFGDRLRLFYQQFNSSGRALFRDALFREVMNREAIVGLEILCPNFTVQRRILQKKNKISISIKWIWPRTMEYFSICVNKPPLECHQFYLPLAD
jgi:hypothetical protein